MHTLEVRDCLTSIEDAAAHGGSKQLHVCWGIGQARSPSRMQRIQMLLIVRFEHDL